MTRSDGHDDLICPTCGYSLTGTSTNTCPECGNEFDPTYLRGLNRKYKGVIEVPPYVISLLSGVLGSVLLAFAMFGDWEKSQSLQSGWMDIVLLALFFLGVSLWHLRRRWKS